VPAASTSNALKFGRRNASFQVVPGGEAWLDNFIALTLVTNGWEKKNSGLGSQVIGIRVRCREQSSGS